MIQSSSSRLIVTSSQQWILGTTDLLKDGQFIWAKNEGPGHETGYTGASNSLAQVPTDWTQAGRFGPNDDATIAASSLSVA
jgi:hypothetical protein